MIADAEAFLHIFHSLYEPAGSFPAGGILIRDTCRNGKTGQLFVDLLSVSFQKHRQDHRVRQTVGHIIFAAKGMCNRVDVPHVRFGKRASRVEGCVEHIAAGFHIAAVIVSGIDIFKNQFHREQGVLPCPVGRGIADVSLHCMGEGVHARGCRDEWRQTQRDLRVEDCVPRDQRKIIDGIFIACLRVRDDCCQRCLASCAGSGRNRHEERQLFMHL